jgi:predicted amidohydrolase
MRLHLIQLRMDPSESSQARIARVKDILENQQGADLIVLPELWLQGAFDMDRFADTAQTLDGEAVSMVKATAKKLNTWIHGGSIITTENERLYNTSFVANPQGELTSIYRKVHLFGFDQGEATVLSAGEELVTTTIDDAIIGITTCYDLRFPEQYRALIEKDVNLFVIPAGWPDRRIEHWTILNKARAIENQCFVAAVNAVGPSGDVTLGGKSIVIDPWGQGIAEAGADEEVLIAEIDLAQVEMTRKQFPVLRDRRDINRI